MINVIENGNYSVYIHTSPSGKMYIGQTGVEPKKRWRNGGKGYLSKKNGRYIQPVFAHAIIKYGWDNFDHEIIASNLTKEEADNFEKLLIEKLNTRNSKHGYNLREGGSNGGHSEETKRKIGEVQKGKVMSEESKRKISESLKGKNSPLYGKHPSKETKKKMSEASKNRVITEETKKRLSKVQRSMQKPNARKVKQYDLNGSLIKIWNSMGEAARELRFDKTNIYNCCSGRCKTALGFIWIYYEDELTKEHLDLCNKRKITNKRCVAQYSLSGEFICMFESMHEATFKTGVSYANISKCCIGNRKTAGGYIWKCYEDIKIAV